MINSLRSLAVSAFKNSEVIGETVLSYAPVPGKRFSDVDCRKYDSAQWILCYYYFTSGRGCCQLSY